MQSKPFSPACKTLRAGKAAFYSCVFVDSVIQYFPAVCGAYFLIESLHMQLMYGEDCMPNFTHSLNIVGRCTQMQRGQALKDLGICGGQVPYLLRLCRMPGLSQEELAKGLYVNKSTAARVITHLEKAGYVERRSSEEDRRCLKLFPTEKALNALPQIRATVQGWNDYLLDEFTDEEKDALVAMLARVSERAQAYIQREVGWDA